MAKILAGCLFFLATASGFSDSRTIVTTQNVADLSSPYPTVRWYQGEQVTWTGLFRNGSAAYAIPDNTYPVLEVVGQPPNSQTAYVIQTGSVVSATGGVTRFNLSAEQSAVPVQAQDKRQYRAYIKLVQPSGGSNLVLVSAARTVEVLYAPDSSVIAYAGPFAPNSVLAPWNVTVEAPEDWPWPTDAEVEEMVGEGGGGGGGGGGGPVDWDDVENKPAGFADNVDNGITAETDPQWSADKSDYYTKTTADNRYLQEETDPVWTEDKGDYLTEAESDGRYLQSESDPVYESEKSRYATGSPVFVESDPVWSGVSNSIRQDINSKATGTPLYVESGLPNFSESNRSLFPTNTLLTNALNACTNSAMVWPTASIINTSEYTVIVAGSSQRITKNPYSIIVGGLDNAISNDQASIWHAYCVIVGGLQNNMAGGRYNFIGGGTGNNMDRNDNEQGVIVGGKQNYQERGEANFIGGGRANGEYFGNYAVIVGGFQNRIDGSSSFIGSGDRNYMSGSDSVLAGGQDCRLVGSWSVLCGGSYNGVTSRYAFVGGGYANRMAGDNASGDVGPEMAGLVCGYENLIGPFANMAFLGAGYSNRVAGTGSETGYYGVVVGGAYNNVTNWYGMVVGGLSNLAGGVASMANGWRAKAKGDGSFVWADKQDADFATVNSNVFLVRAQNGVGINTNNPQDALHVKGNARADRFVFPLGDYLASNGTNVWYININGASNNLTSN